ncbi:MAG: Zn-dependent hydrolase, partial [Bacteroidales bacterium]|nr:Zn-dependent hydrolase [Bacteroidales bacterium]
MVKKTNSLLGLIVISFFIISCSTGTQKKTTDKQETSTELTAMQKNLQKYVSVKLTADISHLSENEKEMLKLLFEASKLMDDIFWMQNIGDKKEFLATIDDPDTRAYAMINYGPWDEMANLKPFIDIYGEKPAGSEFYPHDMTEEEFEAFDDPNKTSLYTLIRRNDDGSLKTIWYHEAFQEQVTKAAELLKKASELAGDKEFAHYLALRSEALLT